MSVCPAILTLKPYQGGKPISELERELKLDSVVKLGSNENPLGVGGKSLQAMTQALAEVNRYPDSNGFELKNAISQHLSVSPEMITMGNGSNDVLQLVASAYICNGGDEVVVSEYAFMVYRLVAEALGASVITVPSIEFGHDLTQMFKVITAKTKLIFIANPNNPSGTLLSDDRLYDFLKKTPKSVVVVLDQAYFEYLDTVDNAIDWLAEFDNLVITRTFSKAYGLAGLRVGYAISSGQIADYLNRIRQPFNVNHIAQKAAVAALKDKDFLRQSIIANQQGLLQLSKGFAALNLSFIPSAANFVAVKIDNAARIYQQLLSKGFISRLVEMPDYLRISVGTKDENTAFLSALASVLNE